MQAWAIEWNNSCNYDCNKTLMTGSLDCCRRMRCDSSSVQMLLPAAWTSLVFHMVGPACMHRCQHYRFRAGNTPWSHFLDRMSQFFFLPKIPGKISICHTQGNSRNILLLWSLVVSHFLARAFIANENGTSNGDP